MPETMTNFLGHALALATSGGWSFLMFVIVLSVLVFVHELGHYLAARSVGMGVEAFSIGFGKEILGWYDKHGTRWKIALLPFGGYVKLYGDETVEGIEEENLNKAFLNKTVWQRMWVVAAGPLSNFAFAIVAFMCLMYAGEQRMLPKVGSVLPDAPAAQAGIKTGDLITSIDGKPVEDWLGLQDAITATGGRTVPVTLQREGTAYALFLTPIYKDRETRLGEKASLPFAGIGPSGERFTTKHGALESVKLGFVRTWENTALIWKSLGKMVTGAISSDKVGGPLMIAEVAGDAGKAGLYPLVMLMIVISINLGMINLFPIPVLDGGHLMYFLIEAVKGSPVSDRVKEYGDRIGIAAVIALMIFATFNDITRLFSRFF